MSALSIEVGEYKTLSLIKDPQTAEVGSVLWVCRRDQTPDALSQSDDEISRAVKYVAIGNIIGLSVEHAAPINPGIRVARCIDMFSPAGNSKPEDTDGYHIEHDISHNDTTTVTLSLPEILLPTDFEIRRGKGLWSQDSIIGSLMMLELRNQKSIPTT